MGCIAHIAGELIYIKQEHKIRFVCHEVPR